jgi:hypothetical protein
MVRQTPLDRLKESTSDLVVQNLRSDSAVIARLSSLISEAVESGISHRSIHEALIAGGLMTSWTNYRVALGRARRAKRTAGWASTTVEPSPLRAPSAAQRASVREAGLAEPLPEPLLASSAEPGEMHTRGGTSCATRVMDALRQAREVANSKDYGQIARDRYRQEQRDRRRKDRP